MNPFDLAGPRFLLFYIVLTVVTYTILLLVKRWREMGGADDRQALLREPITDPYRMAYLRGGREEMLRVVIVSLVDRGYLVNEGRKFRTTELADRTPPRRAIEQQVTESFRTPSEPLQIYRFGDVDQEVDQFERTLASQRLLPDAEIRVLRGTLKTIGMLILGSVGVTKIMIGMSRGKPVLFLVILTFVALLLLPRLFKGRLTARGVWYLREVRNLFDSLRLRTRRMQPGSASAELALCAGIFGVTMLPAAFAWTQSLYGGRAIPPPGGPDGSPDTTSSATSWHDSSHGSSSDTSSDSSSDTSSDSSSCGSSSCGSSGCGGCGSS